MMAGTTVLANTS
jgi:hypothetical protein